MYNPYHDNIEVGPNENRTLKTIEELLTITNERFRVNQSANYLEMKEVQKTYEDSKSRQVLLLYNAKIAEIELLRLQGKISSENF